MAYNYRDIPQIVREILAAKAEDGGVKNVYFVGCGGSLGALYPAKVFVERESLGLKTGWINSNEFVHSTPKDFGKNSVLCVACHAGNTPETVAAAKLGKAVHMDGNKTTFVTLYGLEACEGYLQQENAKALAALEPFEDRAFLTELTKRLASRDH